MHLTVCFDIKFKSNLVFLPAAKFSIVFLLLEIAFGNLRKCRCLDVYSRQKCACGFDHLLQWTDFQVYFLLILWTQVHIRFLISDFRRKKKKRFCLLVRRCGWLVAVLLQSAWGTAGMTLKDATFLSLHFSFAEQWPTKKMCLKVSFLMSSL